MHKAYFYIFLYTKKHPKKYFRALTSINNELEHPKNILVQQKIRPLNCNLPPFSVNSRNAKLKYQQLEKQTLNGIEE